jgi:hypothetical protein
VKPAAPGRRRLVEAHAEWQVGERRYLSEGSYGLLATPAKHADRRMVKIIYTQRGTSPSGRGRASFRVPGHG